MCNIMAARGIREAWEWGKRRRRGQKMAGVCAHFTHKADVLLTQASFNHNALIFLPLTSNPGLPLPLTQCLGSPVPKAVGWR